eukprot:CAMPEP_0119313870 /NCGR_PEP_ID=MMETSP1333-20130426/30702_1 /TAXON_ID=418940 /ORGANISM="Scyphosphaera apsteinii, Strain RCC1455" /LENGTH=62 /DNA_ID=CAMNT_0007318841 /DNA_START=53 /DNA_END=237 /DNA_ORIENTATION=+
MRRDIDAENATLPVSDPLIDLVIYQIASVVFAKYCHLQRHATLLQDASVQSARGFHVEAVAP